MINPTPILIPDEHLIGFDVWIGNDLAGECWHDRWGYRWFVRWVPPARFINGTADNFADCVKAIVDNHRN